MIRKRILAVLATAGTALGLTIGVTIPVSHADPLDNIRASINVTRSHTTCPPLNYSPQLEAAAQAWARSVGSDNGNSAGYAGVTTGHANGENDAQDSINRVNVALDATLHDCSWKDFGVGFYRDDFSHVAVFLGRPAAAPLPPPVKCPDGTTVPAGQQCPAPKPPVNCPDGTTVPAGQQCPAPKPVTNAISLSFGPPGFGNITATVSNSSDLNGSCTYDASPSNTHRSFNVPAHGSTQLTFSGLNTGTTYHAVVKCTDASGKQTQPIGSDSKDVRF